MMQKLLFISCFFLLKPAAAADNWDLTRVPEKMRPEIQEKILKDEALSTNLKSEKVIQLLHTDPTIRRVRISQEQGQIKVEVEKSIVISTVKWTGLSALSKSNAEDFFGVASGSLFNQDQILEGAERLRASYQERGYLNAVINVEFPQNESGNVDLALNVAEGLQTQIEGFQIRSGNPELNRDLTHALRKFRRDALSAVSLAEVQTFMRSWLSKQGYFRSDFGAPEITLKDQDRKATLAYRIDRVDSYFVTFSGNRYFSVGKLKSIVSFDEFYTANPLVGNEMATQIRSAYLKKGFARAEVSFEEKEGKRPFEKAVLVKISEGERIRISDFQFSGRLSREPTYYQKLIETNSSELIAAYYYNKEELDLALQGLVLQLQNEGFLMARVISSRVQYNRERNRITVFINLDEGLRTNVEVVTFQGNTSFKSERLQALIGLKNGAPLKLQDIELSIRKLKNFYLENGFLEVKLLNETGDLVQYNSDNTKAGLTYRIQEGPQIRVASIVTEGNTFTKNYVLEREIDIQEGDLLTPSKIDDSISRLQRTGYFNTVEIKTLEEKTSVANRTLVVRVTERDPGLFTLGAGATNERGVTLRGYTGAAYRNILGTGRGVSGRLEGNYNVTDVRYFEYRATLGYLEPYLFNTRLRGRVSLSHSSLVTNYDIGQISQVRQTTYSIEKEFTKNILGVYELYSLATVQDFGLDERYTFPTTSLDIATTGPTLDIDYRDNPFNPSTGTFTRLRAEYSSPSFGSSAGIEYLKATSSFTHYLKLNKRPLTWTQSDSPVVWANNFQAGYLQNLSEDGGVPYDKKGFILGGRTSVRGFEAGTREVFPSITELGTDRYILETDSTMFLFKSELRFPLYGAFGGAVFYDGGSVTISGLDVADPYRESAGFGLRYNTPFGPLNLELAWKLDRKENEDPFKFHLSIGTF